jgi:molecular chaperone DnaK
MTAIGIDFGTTNSVVAAHSGSAVDVLPIDDPTGTWANLGFDRVLPSVIGIGTEQRATFGWAAKQQAANKLEAVKRLFATEDTVAIGGAEYSVEMAAALLFARLKQGAESTGAQVDRAVVTVPANSRGLARFRTKLCAGLAGIEVAALINEPTAAAMAHSIDATDDQNILVFDWGGGTLDVTVLETVAGVFIERASKGIQRSGGLDLDNLLGAAVLRDVPGHEGWSEAERAIFRLEIELAKVVLSRQETTTIALPGGGLHEVRRETLERAIAPKIEETRAPIDQCLEDLRITSDRLDHVVLVGGSSKIPAVRQFVADVLEKEPSTGADPMTAVGEGAAIAAAILSGDLDADFFVATEHALGTISSDDRGMPEFSELIGRNHKLPARAQGGYRPMHAGQKSVRVRVIEGDPTMPIDHPDNVVLKEWEIDIDPERPHEETGFTITYEYDVDGILRVTVNDEMTGAVMLRDDVSYGVSRDKSGLIDLARSVRETMGGKPLGDATSTPSATAPGKGNGHAAGAGDPGAAAILERVRTKIIPFVDDDEVQRLEGMCRDLQHAAGADAESCRSALEAEARKYAYLF